MEAIRHFSATTALEVNTEKSNMYIAGVDDELKQKLLDITCYSIGTFPIRYLGLPLSPKRWSKIDCHQLCVKITEKLKTISNRHLSYAGRLQCTWAIMVWEGVKEWTGAHITQHDLMTTLMRIKRR
ncbi:uncharacterized protein LOC142177201 [Nicotiana tabacum]|uniref:Uncharacterized protein LOC142177201 n=1 Tax=Nicotiana tabacum TaxID=4097 RepID=A0AC58TX04_TOBAC